MSQWIQETIEIAVTSSESSEAGADDRHGSMSEELLSQIQKLSKDVENIWSEVRRHTVFCICYPRFPA